MNIYQKIKQPAIVALVLSAIILLWNLGDFSLNFRNALSFNFRILSALFNYFSSILRAVITYGCIVAFNYLVITIDNRKENKNLLFLLLTFGLTIITYVTYDNFINFMNNIFHYTKFINLFKALVRLGLNGFLFAITLNQFIPYFKYFQNQTAE